MFQYLYSAPGTGAFLKCPRTPSTRDDGEEAALKTVFVLFMKISLCHDSGPRPVPAHAPCGRESAKAAPGHELPVQGGCDAVLALTEHHKHTTRVATPQHTHPTSVYTSPPGNGQLRRATQGPEERHPELPVSRKRRP